MYEVTVKNVPTPMQLKAQRSVYKHAGILCSEVDACLLEGFFLFRIFCSESSAIWPKPTGDITVGNFLTAINIHSIDILGAKSESPTFQLVMDAGHVFKKQLELLIPRFAALEFSNFD